MSETRYPAYRYHPDFGPRLVEDEKHDLALGPGWYRSPDEFPVMPLIPAAMPDMSAIRVSVPVIPYPAYRFAKGQPHRRIENAEQDKALGPGWYKTPQEAEAEPEPVESEADEPEPEASDTAPVKRPRGRPRKVEG